MNVVRDGKNQWCELTLQASPAMEIISSADVLHEERNASASSTFPMNPSSARSSISQGRSSLESFSYHDGGAQGGCGSSAAAVTVEVTSPSSPAVACSKSCANWTCPRAAATSEAVCPSKSRMSGSAPT